MIMAKMAQATYSEAFDDDYDTDVEADEKPPPRKKKLTGAAKYKTKFKDSWKKEFSFITSVPGESYR